MMVLITYDVSFEDGAGEKRLRHIAKICLDYGVRVQYSVFECEVSPDQWVVLQDKLFNAYDPSVDSLRFYKLGKNWRNRVEHHGAKKALDIFKDVLLI
ncbi:MAG: CRISPR-associated endonuclease Cas2 [Hahellaceae bacterium]|nr:CRISPR-associated endonuclease Cas2 [Hahellaceae bacterium]